jgi:hypothetical protein
MLLSMLFVLIGTWVFRGSERRPFLGLLGVPLYVLGGLAMLVSTFYLRELYFGGGTASKEEKGPVELEEVHHKEFGVITETGIQHLDSSTDKP